MFLSLFIFTKKKSDMKYKVIKNRFISHFILTVEQTSYWLANVGVGWTSLFPKHLALVSFSSTTQHFWQESFTIAARQKTLWERISEWSPSYKYGKNAEKFLGRILQKTWLKRKAYRILWDLFFKLKDRCHECVNLRGGGVQWSHN